MQTSSDVARFRPEKTKRFQVQITLDATSTKTAGTSEAYVYDKTGNRIENTGAMHLQTPQHKTAHKTVPPTLRPSQMRTEQAQRRSR